MNYLIQKIKDLLSGAKYTSNQDAAEIIRRFVKGNGGLYEWDDFETTREKNPDVELALHLCWYFARKYPPQDSTAYCGQKACSYFLRIAEALEKNWFRNIDHRTAKQALERNELPEAIKRILETSNDHMGHNT